MVRRFFLFISLLLLPAGPGVAGAFSYTGTFTYDDDVVIIPFTMSAYGSVTIQTWSFGGGVNANGQTIEAGGFAPVLSLVFPDLSIYYASFLTGGCPTCNPDPVTGDTSDAYMSLLLDPGSYFVAITQHDNYPAGSWGDGFIREPDDDPGDDPDGHYFTERWHATPSDPSAPFLYSAGVGAVKRTGFWAVDITGDYVEAAVPEPASLALAGLGLALLVASRRRSV